MRAYLLLLFLGSTLAVPFIRHGKIRSSVVAPMVIDGVPAEDGAWPAQLSLQRYRESEAKWGHTCGATLLNVNYALSAAHCTWNVGPHERLIQAGVNKRDDPTGQIKTLSSILNHPEYRVGSGYPNDVCVLKFTTPMELNDKVQPGLLPESGEDFVNSECIITGWGRTDTSSNIPNDLRQGAVQVLSNTECSGRMPYIRDLHICIRDARGVHGACNGDSGGPVNCRHSDSEPWKQVGVASWVMASSGNCLVYYPSVYGRISYHLDWIAENTV